MGLFDNFRRPSPLIRQIGPYALDSAIPVGLGARALTPGELMLLGIQSTFVGEQLVSAPRTDFVGLRWNVLLATVKNRIYKIALTIETDEMPLAAVAYTKSYADLSARMGRPENVEETWLWKARDGNAVLAQGLGAGRFSVNVYLTSSEIRHARPL
jgi:hypothetical protein